MSTSGNTSFTVTQDMIITKAAKIIGKQGDNASLTAEEYNDCRDMLNLMVKQWIAKNDFAPGLKMFSRKMGFLFLSTNTGTYTLGSAGGTGASRWTNNFATTNSTGSNPAGANTIHVATTTNAVMNMQPDTDSQTGPLANNQVIGIQLDNGSMYWSTITNVPSANTVTIAGTLPASSNSIGNVVYAFSTIASPPQVIEKVVLRDSNGEDTPVRLVNMEDWMNNPSKQSPGYTGDPVSVYYEPHLNGNNGQGIGYLHTDVAAAQDVSKYLVILYLTEFEDFVNPSDEMYFPKEWGMALIYGLGKHIGPMFDMVWTNEMKEIEMSSIRFARNANNRKSIDFFQPGNRGDTNIPNWR